MGSATSPVGLAGDSAETPATDYRGYFDNSELKVGFAAAIPDTFCLGGFLLKSASIPNLIAQVRSAKKALIGDEDLPIKWNILDLRKWYDQAGLTATFEKIKPQTNEIRATLLNLLIKEGAVLFASVISGYSDDRQKISDVKQDLVGYCFANLIMRVGLRVSKDGATKTELVLDWPDRNDRTPYLTEYRTGFQSGQSGGTKYICGNLKNLGFADNPFFSSGEYDHCLQLADLLTGATKDFVNFAIGKVSKESFGVQLFSHLVGHFDKNQYGYCLGRGLTVAPANGQLSTKVLDALKQL